MPISKLLSWFGGRDAASRRTPIRFQPQLGRLESREVLNGYIAIGAGAGAPPLVAIRVDKLDLLTGQPPNPSGQPPAPSSDGRTDFTSQIFQPYASGFRGGVHTASGNFDGLYTTPDFLVTAPGVGGGPHVKVWTMVQDIAGNITVGGLFTEFLAYTPRFTGGVNVTTGDLDGDGRAELIVGAGPGGGPHVKIYKLDISDRKAVLVNEFMAYDPNFRGGVSVASGQGYQTPLQVRQVFNTTTGHPDDFGGLPATAYTDYGATRPGDNNVPGQTIPLSGVRFDLDGGNIVTRATFTVGSGVIQYAGANLLNNYGNIGYEPNVADLDPVNGFDESPPEQPLVYATWTADSDTIPPWAVPEVVYGPFVQSSPAVGDAPPVVTPLQLPPGQVNARNQLITGPGVGGGPLVRVWDFLGQPNGSIRQNEMIQFNAFDPNFRGGINVAIGTFIEIPNPDITGVVRPGLNTTDLELQENRLYDPVTTFPFTRNIYRQYSPQIAVTPASGGGAVVIMSDYNPDNPFTGIPDRRTSITQLNMVPTILDTKVVPDPGNPLNGFLGLLDVTYFDAPIDPQYRGQILAATSALLFNGTASSARVQTAFGAGTSTIGPSRGPLVKIFDRFGPLLFGAGNTVAPQTPLDQFQAFLSGFFPNGVGGMSYGFGQLDEPTRDVFDLSLIGQAPTVSDPAFDPPVDRTG